MWRLSSQGLESTTSFENHFNLAISHGSLKTFCNCNRELRGSVKFCLLACAGLGAAQSVTIKTEMVIDGQGGMRRDVAITIERSKIAREPFRLQRGTELVWCRMKFLLSGRSSEEIAVPILARPSRQLCNRHLH